MEFSSLDKCTYSKCQFFLYSCGVKLLNIITVELNVYLLTNFFISNFLKGIFDKKRQALKSNIAETTQQQGYKTADVVEIGSKKAAGG